LRRRDYLHHKVCPRFVIVSILEGKNVSAEGEIASSSAVLLIAKVIRRKMYRSFDPLSTGTLSLRQVFLSLLFSFCIASSTIAEEYVINPGDTVSILVWGHEEYTQIISVRLDGKISYPFLGEVKVDNLTTIELSEKIRKELLKHLRDPQVTVAIVQSRKNEIFVLGQVAFPNQLRFDQDRLSLLKALSMAGGILDDTADLHSVKIVRDDGTSEIIDLEKLLSSEPQRSVFLYPQDLVYVPKQERVRVTGYVLNPGEYRARSNLSIAQALALAGGQLQDAADPSKALIVKATGEVIGVEIGSDFWIAGEQIKLHELHPGDTLYIPNAYSAQEVNLLGYVRNPGQYKIKRPITLFEALAFAGGITDVNKADLQKSRIIRGDGNVELFDLSALSESDPENLKKAGSLVLYPGDTFEIPQKKKNINWSWSLVLTVLSVISIVYNLTSRMLE